MMTSYSQPQELDTFILNKKGKICFYENQRKSVYSGYIKAKVYSGNFIDGDRRRNRHAQHIRIIIVPIKKSRLLMGQLFFL